MLEARGRSPAVTQHGSQLTSLAVIPLAYVPIHGMFLFPGFSLEEHVEKLHISFTLSYVSPGIFYCWVSVYVRKKSKTESVPVIWRVCESVYKHTSGGSLERLPNSVIQFVVGDWAPVLRLLVANRPEVCKRTNQTAHHYLWAWAVHLLIAPGHLD